MISFNRHLATSRAFSVRGRLPPILRRCKQYKQIFISSGLWHLSKVHNQVFKRSSSNILHLGWYSQPLSGMVFYTQTAHFTHYLTYAGDLGDVKMLGQGGLKSCPP
jgi:hypothetical protein